MTATKKKIDFTTGSIFPKLISFSLPIIISNILQTLYNAADMMIASLSDEPNAVGAIGTTGSFTGLMVTMFIGFSIGSNVTIARHVGSNDKERASRAAHTAIVLALLSGVICGIIGICITRTVLGAMGNTGHVLTLSSRYSMIYFSGLPFISLTNFLCSIFRARGDSQTPLKVLAFSGMSNVLMNLFCVLVLKMSVEGVAIATVMANVISSIILLTKLVRSNDEYTSIKFSKLKIDARELRDIIVIGLPSSIQSMLFSVSNMMVQSSIITLDKMLSPDPEFTPVMNGFAAQSNLDYLVYLSMNAIYQTTTTFTSQNRGAGRFDRIKRGVFMNYIVVFTVGIIASGTIILFQDFLLSLYGITTGAPGTVAAIAHNTAVTRAHFICIPYFLCGFMEVGTGILRGLGKAIAPFIIAFIGACGIRILWTSIVFPLDPTLQNLFISFPVGWGVSAISAFILALFYIKRAKLNHQS